MVHVSQQCVLHCRLVSRLCCFWNNFCVSIFFTLIIDFYSALLISSMDNVKCKPWLATYYVYIHRKTIYLDLPKWYTVWNRGSRKQSGTDGDASFTFGRPNTRLEIVWFQRLNFRPCVHVTLKRILLFRSIKWSLITKLIVELGAKLRDRSNETHY